MVGIEAQAAGLGCVFSDAVPAEVAAFFPCHPDPAFRQQCRLGSRLAADAPPALRPICWCRLIRQAGYDINIAAARLQQQYLQLGGQA